MLLLRLVMVMDFYFHLCTKQKKKNMIFFSSWTHTWKKVSAYVKEHIVWLKKRPIQLDRIIFWPNFSFFFFFIIHSGCPSLFMIHAHLWLTSSLAVLLWFLFWSFLRPSAEMSHFWYGYAQVACERIATERIFSSLQVPVAVDLFSTSAAQQRWKTLRERG